MSRQINFPNKKYNIIYADPPWHFKHWNDKTVTRKVPYDVMSKEDIKNLTVKDLADDNCILFVWVTFPKLLDGIETIKSWGFEYKTVGFVWIKTNKKYNVNQTSFLPYEALDSFWGLGYWTRSNAELCLIATKGKPKRVSMGVHQIVYEPVREHSRKPDIIRDKIVELCGNIPRIELFARTKIDGWDHWGNETEKYTKKTSKEI